MRGRIRQALGFSLLEVMISLAIFSIGILALIPLFATAQWGVRGGRDLSTATSLARTYIDNLRNTPFNSLGPCDPGNPGNANATCVPITAAERNDNLPFVVTWTVQAVNGAAYPFVAPVEPFMKRITVTVTCATCARQNLRIQMTTIVAQRS